MKKPRSSSNISCESTRTPSSGVFSTCIRIGQEELYRYSGGDSWFQRAAYASSGFLVGSPAETGVVSIGCPDFVDTSEAADRRYARIMDQRARNFPGRPASP